MKSVQIRSYFWSVFSGIRTEYSNLRNKLRSNRKFCKRGRNSFRKTFYPSPSNIPFFIYENIFIVQVNKIKQNKLDVYQLRNNKGCLLKGTKKAINIIVKRKYICMYIYIYIYIYITIQRSKVLNW